MAKKEYVVTVTNNGKITLPAPLRKAKKWTGGSKLVFKVSDDDNNGTVTLTKKNLYETSFGDYDFQKAMDSDPELNTRNSAGKEGWGFENE